MKVTASCRICDQPKGEVLDYSTFYAECCSLSSLEDDLARELTTSDQAILRRNHFRLLLREARSL
jgi:hypothetical protein